MDKRGNVRSTPLRLSLHTIAELESNLLFFRTGIQRDASSVLADQKEKMGKKESSKDMIRALDEIKALGQDVKKYLMKGKVDDFGATLHTHWLIKKKLSSKVSSAQIDDWYEAAMKAGALGGKIMGAGGGGWFMFYVPKNKEFFRTRMKRVGLDERMVHFDCEGTKLLINLS
jgi:D-glycero-alpha-D-manno-heptose-7-phosphate kinase